MLLSVHFSPDAAELLAEGRIDCDTFKVPDWDEVIAAASELRPVEVHFPLQLGASLPAESGLDRVAELLERTNTPRLNLHVAPSRERFPDLAVDDVGQSARKLVLDGLLADLAPFAERFGAENLMLENLPYRGPERGLLRAGVDAELLGSLLAASGCGLLLDVAHAVITAATLGIDVDDYLGELPTATLVDLHVSGVRELDGSARDHMPLSAQDWELIERVFLRVATGDWPVPRSVALEYGGIGPVFAWRTDSEVLAAELPRLAQLAAPWRSLVN